MKLEDAYYNATKDISSPILRAKEGEDHNDAYKRLADDGWDVSEVNTEWEGRILHFRR